MPFATRCPNRTADGARRLAGLVVATMLVVSPASSPARAATDAPAASTADTAIDAHIASLHKALAITPAQEKLWGDVAAAMRQNAQELQDLLATRKAQFGGMDAVADLQSYADFMAKRSAEISRLIPPFTALYAALSPSQKATADRIFRNHADRAEHRAAPPR